MGRNVRRTKRLIKRRINSAKKRFTKSRIKVSNRKSKIKVSKKRLTKRLTKRKMNVSKRMNKKKMKGGMDWPNPSARMRAEGLPVLDDALRRDAVNFLNETDNIDNILNKYYGEHDDRRYLLDDWLERNYRVSYDDMNSVIISAVIEYLNNHNSVVRGNEVLYPNEVEIVKRLQNIYGLTDQEIGGAVNSSEYRILLPRYVWSEENGENIVEWMPGSKVAGAVNREKNPNYGSYGEGALGRMEKANTRPLVVKPAESRGAASWSKGKYVPPQLSGPDYSKSWGDFFEGTQDRGSPRPALVRPSGLQGTLSGVAKSDLSAASRLMRGSDVLPLAVNKKSSKSSKQPTERRQSTPSGNTLPPAIRDTSEEREEEEERAAKRERQEAARMERAAERRRQEVMRLEKNKRAEEEYLRRTGSVSAPSVGDSILPPI